MSASAGQRRRPAHNPDSYDRQDFNRRSSRVASDETESDSDEVSDVDDGSSDGASDETGSVIVLDLSGDSSGRTPTSVNRQAEQDDIEHDRDVEAFCCRICKQWRVGIAGRIFNQSSNGSYHGPQCIICRTKGKIRGYHTSHALNEDDAQGQLEEHAAEYIDRWVDTLIKAKADFRNCDIEDLLLVVVQWIPYFLATTKRRQTLAAMRREMSPRTYQAKCRRRSLPQVQKSNDAACCIQARPASFTCGLCATARDPTFALYRCQCSKRGRHFAYGTQCLACRARHALRWYKNRLGRGGVTTRKEASTRIPDYIATWKAQIGQAGYPVSEAGISKVENDLKDLIQPELDRNNTTKQYTFKMYCPPTVSS